MQRRISKTVAAVVMLVALGTAGWGWAQGPATPAAPQYQAFPQQPAGTGPAMQTQGPPPAYQQPPPAYSQPQQPAYSQPQQPAYSQPQQPAYSQPQQPVYSQPQPANTQLQAPQPIQRPMRPQPVVQAPFVLTPAEQAQLEQALHDWEKANTAVTNYRCQFERLQWDKVFNTPNGPGKPMVDKGEIRYSAPDHGLFSVEGAQPEKWIYDGRAIYEYKFPARKGDPGTLVEHRLPRDAVGKPIADAPLPFMFGDTAPRLQRRYFMKLVTPQSEVGKQIWIRACPRYQQDLANFTCADVILNAKDKMPVALQLFMANGNRTVYNLSKAVPNNLFENIFEQDPFKPSLDRGWKKETDNIPSSSPPPQTVGSRPPYGMAR